MLPTIHHEPIPPSLIEKFSYLSRKPTHRRTHNCDEIGEKTHQNQQLKWDVWLFKCCFARPVTPDNCLKWTEFQTKQPERHPERFHGKHVRTWCPFESNQPDAPGWWIGDSRHIFRFDGSRAIEEWGNLGKFMLLGIWIQFDPRKILSRCEIRHTANSSMMASCGLR